MATGPALKGSSTVGVGVPGDVESGALIDDEARGGVRVGSSRGGNRRVGREDHARVGVFFLIAASGSTLQPGFARNGISVPVQTA